VVADLATALRAKYGANLDRVLLFGSRARGDYHEDSDIDVMVVLKKIDSFLECWDKIGEIAYAVSFDSNRPVVVSALLCQTQDLDQAETPLRQNVVREGVAIS
jgi:uncharacterized protein